MEAIQRIEIPLNGEAHFYRIPMRQTDSGRKLVVTVYDGGKGLDIPSDAVVEFNARNPVDQIITRTEGVTHNGSEVTVAVSQNVLAIPGDVKCELVITGKAGQQIGTVNFFIRVWAAVVSAKDIENLPDYQAVQAARLAAEVARDEAEQYAAEAAISAADADVSAKTAEEIEHNPVRVGENGNLWNWDSASKKWVDSGIAASSGDMARNVYDPLGKATDVFAYAMAKEVYDPEDEVKAAGGITSYVDLALATKANKEWITGTFAAQTGDAGIKYRYNKDLRQLILEGSSTLAGGAWAVGHTIFTLANNPELPRPRGALAITGSIFLIGTGVTSAIRAVVATSGVVSVAGIYGTATQSLDINAVIYLDSNWNI